MKFSHRIAMRSDDPLWRDIESAGVPIDRSGSSLIWAANVTEDDPAWPEVRRILRDRPEFEVAKTIYTKGELDAAEWLQMSALGHHGYPQPAGDFGYKDRTYDVAEHCPICGIGAMQKAPFRLHAEPKARNSQFVQLNWVFDEFFVRSNARQGLESAGISGLAFVPPVLHKNDRPSAEVAQMQVATILPAALDTNGLAPVTCKAKNEEWRPDDPLRPAELSGAPYCGRVKYHAFHRGPLRFERAAFEGAPDVVKSHEYFGSGGAASRWVLVSQRFRQVVRKAKWRGLSFEPVELIGART